MHAQTQNNFFQGKLQKTITEPSVSNFTSEMHNQGQEQKHIIDGSGSSLHPEQRGRCDPKQKKCCILLLQLLETISSGFDGGGVREMVLFKDLCMWSREEENKFY